MKASSPLSCFTFTVIVLIFHATETTSSRCAQLSSSCQEEQNAAETCFMDLCADCDPLNVDVQFDETTQLNDLQDALSINVSAAKDCCPECSTEIDNLTTCVTPTICINGECLGNGSFATTAGPNGMLKAGMAVVITVAVLTGMM